MATIAGRVTGARPGQRIVVYAKSGPWWVQPLADQPFTEIQENAKWSTATHLGYEYAALLVEPGFQPPPRIDALPVRGEAVVSVTTVKGLPPFWQTWWFRAGATLLILFLLWCAHIYHLRQLTRQFNMRIEERVRERTRIARELHDTLLQSFQGVLLRFQAISNEMAEGETKQKLDRAIDLAAQAVTEGRDAVQGLRSPVTGASDLAAAVNALGEELAANETSEKAPRFGLEVEGEPRELHAMLRDEVYRIAGEAMRNAFRHAHAKRIQVEIHYDTSQLRVRIRDDGKGMDAAVRNREERVGHWGLRGMHERARLLGGNLEVWSKRDSGTEIELNIPAATAYPASGDRRRWRFFWGETGKGRETDD